MRAPSAPIDEGALRALAWARIAVGTLYLFRSTPLIGLFDPTIGADARPLLGWPDGSENLGLGVSAGLLVALCLARTAAFLAFTIGFFPRASGLVAAGAGYLVLLERPFAFTATQHLFLQATMLLALADVGALASVRREPPRSPRTGLWMMRAFVVSVYAWAALAKARADWLDGRTLALFHEEGRLRGSLADLLLASPARCAAMGKVVFVVEASLCLLLCLPRTRLVGVVAAAAFHIGIEWMGHPDVIGWVMLSLLLVFVPLSR
jgi:hypothetical protein